MLYAKFPPLREGDGVVVEIPPPGRAGSHPRGRVAGGRGLGQVAEPVCEPGRIPGYKCWVCRFLRGAVRN
jgi:hypothetical protein